MARRNIKRTRAVLRLFRATISNKAYKEAMLQLREAAQLLAGSRDMQICVETLRILARGRAAGPAETAAQKLEHVPGACSAEACANAERVLESLSTRIRGWCPVEIKCTAAEKGLRRLECRAMRAYSRARSSPKTRTFHEWRKRVKDYGFAIKCLARLRPRLHKKLGRKLRDLGDALGKEHDVAVTLDRLSKVHPGALPDLKPIARERRKKLRKRALKIGKAVFK